MNLLFVCSGNTCRSPMAAALCAAAAKARGMESVRTASAGLWANEGEPAAPHMQSCAAARGLDLSAHKAKLLPLHPELMAWADRVVCLSARHAAALKDFPRAYAALRVLGGGVSDPYGGSAEAYSACAAAMETALPALLREAAFFQAPGSRVAPAGGALLPALAELERRCFARPWSEAQLRETLENPAAVVLAATENGRLLGYVSLTAVLDQADVGNLAVAPGSRRRGAANALLAQAETAAILRGCREIRLETRESNAAALALYAARGYAIVGRRPNYYEAPAEDAVLMTLHIR
jgi:ribosomal-protein-alanine N-acetyltransferase